MARLYWFRLEALLAEHLVISLAFRTWLPRGFQCRPCAARQATKCLKLFVRFRLASHRLTQRSLHWLPERPETCHNNSFRNTKDHRACAAFLSDH